MGFHTFKEKIDIDSLSSRKADLFYIELSSFDSIKDLVDEHIVKMRFGTDNREIRSAKDRIRKFLDKKDDAGKKAAISEFLTTLFLINQGFKQQFIFANLEDYSFKKGFDGIFRSDGNEMWIMECKSTSTISAFSHKNNIKEAIKCIKDKIDSDRNDPWENALHHLMQINYKDRSKKILGIVKELSKDFDINMIHDLSEFNIVPSSVCWFISKFEMSKLKSDIEAIKTKKDANNIIFVCIDSNVFVDFLDYLEK